MSGLALLPAVLFDLDMPSPALISGMAGGFQGDPEGAHAALLEGLSILSDDAGPHPWGPYWAVAGERIVGLCGFKGGPDGDGAVEIAYLTFPDYEGAGVGRAMAQSLVKLALASGASAVLAHTLPVEAASPAILRRAGFDFLGEVEDPEDGPVWRWRKAP